MATARLLKPDEPASKCAVELGKILVEGSAVAKAIRAEFPRSSLSRWSKATRLPELEAAVALRRLSKGRLPVEGWIEPAPEPEICKACGGRV